MFNNPLRKYQSGGNVATPQQQQQIAKLFEAASKNTGIDVETLMSAANELKDENSMKQYVEAISLAAQGDQTAITAIKKMFSQQSPVAFAKGGKLGNFICKHAKGGHLAGCGCKDNGGKINKRFTPTSDAKKDGFAVKRFEWSNNPDGSTTRNQIIADEYGRAMRQSITDRSHMLNRNNLPIRDTINNVGRYLPSAQFVPEIDSEQISYGAHPYFQEGTDGNKIKQWTPEMQYGGVLDYFNYSKMSPEQARYNLQLVNISRDSGKTFGRGYSTGRPEGSPGDKIEDISPKAYGEPGNARLLTGPEEFPGDSVLVGYPVERTLYDRSVINNKMPGGENARNKGFELIRSNKTYGSTPKDQIELDRQRVKLRTQSQPKEENGGIVKGQGGISRIPIRSDKPITQTVSDVYSDGIPREIRRIIDNGDTTIFVPFGSSKKPLRISEEMILKNNHGNGYTRQNRWYNRYNVLENSEKKNITPEFGKSGNQSIDNKLK